MKNGRSHGQGNGQKSESCFTTLYCILARISSCPRRCSFDGAAVPAAAVGRPPQRHQLCGRPLFLDVFLTALLTDGYLFSILIAVTGVLCVDYVFTEPYWEISFTLAGFPLTFIVMMFISVVTGMLTSRAKQVESLKREAERERIHSNLLRAVSHDIRTPLTGIVGATDVLLDQENALTPEQRHQLLSSANEDARWLIRIVENLLSITRIGAQGDAKVTKTLAVAEEVIEGAVAKFTSRGGKLPVHVHLPQEVLLVPMDELLIEQVLLNLLETPPSMPRAPPRWT